jgi:hypothetical protein
MESIANFSMSPRERHIPDEAVRTTVSLTAEDRAAINWISTVRSLAKSKRTTINDILVDSLWHFLEKTEKKTRDQMREMVPTILPEARPENKVTEMPKPKSKR